jgi:hypothetical protein
VINMFFQNSIKIVKSSELQTLHATSEILLLLEQGFAERARLPHSSLMDSIGEEGGPPRLFSSWYTFSPVNPPLPHLLMTVVQIVKQESCIAKKLFSSASPSAPYR